MPLAEINLNLGALSTVVHDVTVGKNAKLGSLTLVMKGEEIPPHSRWRRSPEQPRH